MQESNFKLLDNWGVLIPDELENFLVRSHSFDKKMIQTNHELDGKVFGVWPFPHDRTMNKESSCESPMSHRLLDDSFVSALSALCSGDCQCVAKSNEIRAGSRSVYREADRREHWVDCREHWGDQPEH